MCFEFKALPRTSTIHRSEWDIIFLFGQKTTKIVPRYRLPRAESFESAKAKGLLLCPSPRLHVHASGRQLVTVSVPWSLPCPIRLASLTLSLREPRNPYFSCPRGVCFQEMGWVNGQQLVWRWEWTSRAFKKSMNSALVSVLTQWKQAGSGAGSE